MKTLRKVNIESRTDEETGWVIADDDSEDSEYTDIQGAEKERVAEFAAKWGVTPEFIYELNSMFGSFRDAVHSDLADIWERLDDANIP